MGLSMDTLKRMVARREIPIVQARPGAKRTVLRSDIDAYLEKHRVPADEEVEQ